jgi:hypothetical protein
MGTGSASAPSTQLIDSACLACWMSSLPSPFAVVGAVWAIVLLRVD